MSVREVSGYNPADGNEWVQIVVTDKLDRVLIITHNSNGTMSVQTDTINGVDLNEKDVQEVITWLRNHW